MHAQLFAWIQRMIMICCTDPVVHVGIVSQVLVADKPQVPVVLLFSQVAMCVDISGNRIIRECLYLPNSFYLHCCYKCKHNPASVWVIFVLMFACMVVIMLFLSSCFIPVLFSQIQYTMQPVTQCTTPGGIINFLYN